MAAKDDPATGPARAHARASSSGEKQRPAGALRLHPDAERIPQMDAKAYAAFRSDIQARGLQVPLEITSEDVVLDGRERLRAACELGLEQLPVRIVAPEDEL